ncbi:MAG TPA: c-type cytochrome [Gallionella sp.]|nr:c-type cytochrome [Gallionella sp.]
MKSQKVLIGRTGGAWSREGLLKVAAGIVGILFYVLAPLPAAAADEIEVGRRIYLEGVLPTGIQLTGVRFGKTEVSGAQAACVNCHRRSGMGSVEGDIQVSPITGNFLFATREDKHLATMDPRIGKRFNLAHDPYTDETLARAIRHGVNANGREMNEMMPRYKFNDSEMKALIAYLRQLSTQWSPGVADDNIRFATVITPDVDPERRKTFISMMRMIVNQKNGSTMTAKQSGGKRQHMVSAAEMVLGTERTWTLDVWELQGAPETWGEQLAAHYRAQPVFAVVSGLSNSTWQPVHDFCEREQVPCWFPSVDLPVMPQSQYSLYFSRGVTLEADVLARHLLAKKADQRPQRIFQVYRRDDYVAHGGAQALAHALAGSGIKVEARLLQDAVLAEPPLALQHALAGIEDKSAVMFWLRPGDVAALDKVPRLPEGLVYFSGALTNGERAPFPAAWKAKAQLVYPYELPEQREANLAYLRAWLNMRKVPMVDEVMQSEVFFSLSFLTETVAEMLNNMYRDYLVERAENMLSLREGSRVEQETRERMMLGRPGDLTRKHGAMTIEEGSRIQLMPTQSESMATKREGTTVYPRLGLAPGQRFASKGAYIVRFADASGNKLVAETDWIVP